MYRFNKSTLEVMGSTVEGEDDWAIVGGTGVFAMARGVIAQQLIGKDSQLAIQKLTIDGFCYRKVCMKTICIYIYILFTSNNFLG
jgi:hypothetical protein